VSAQPLEETRPSAARIADAVPPPPSLRILLAPRVLAARTALRHSRTKVAILTLVTAAFWTGSFVFFERTLSYFQTITALGPMLTQRLLVMLFVSFFAVLVISNVVTALTTFYLAPEVRLLLAAPIPWRRIHDARFVETVVASSWMVLLFGLPAFLAYGVVYRAGVLFYLGTVVTLVPFLLIPAAIGVLVTTALVLAFPARRARDVLVVATVALAAIGYLTLRLVRPERLASPSELAGFAAFLAAFDAPASPYLPTTWAADILIALLGARPGEPLFYLALLTTTAGVLYFASASVVERLLLTAWSRAQEGRTRARRAPLLGRILPRLTAPLPRVPALLLTKDITVFFRDASQWSQLLLLGALVVVYVYNFSVLPIDDGTPLAATLRDVVAFCNLGLAAFVTASVAVRFVYPSVSLEGRVWWVLRSAPVPLATLWWSKFLVAFLPLTLLGETLIVITNRYLGVASELTLVFMATLLFVIAAIVSLGLAFGAAYPRLDSNNAAQIATGFGGVVYMVTCLALIAGVIALEAWPVARLFWHRIGARPLTPLETGAVAVAFASALVVTAVVTEVARRSALRSLAALQL
jgi:ABC-2 type transport system permease protein